MLLDQLSLHTLSHVGIQKNKLFSQYPAGDGGVPDLVSEHWITKCPDAARL